MAFEVGHARFGGHALRTGADGLRACSRCHQRKPVSGFYVRKVKYASGYGTKHATYCKDCRQNTPGRRFVLTYLLSHPCVDCGEPDPRVLQFDHRDRATKAAPVSKLVWGPVARLEAEINKCDVRCANCHVRRTATQMGWHSAL